MTEQEVKEKLQTLLTTPSELTYEYYSEDDILYITVRPTDFAETVELDGLNIDVEPESGEIVGLEIFDFKQSVCRQRPELAKLMARVEQARKNLPSVQEVLPELSPLCTV